MSGFEREIRTAVNWWANELPLPKERLAVQAGAVGDPHMDNPMATAAFAMLADAEAADVTPERVNAFREALERRVRDRVESLLPEHWVTLATDYGPEPPLSDALVEAGFKGSAMSLLPMKTCMHVRPGKVSVGKGYGASFVDLELEDVT